MNGNDIRKSFLTFFEEKDHLRMPSSSLIPAADPTLLLTSAGMVPFKPYFTGEMLPPSNRLTSVQKCFRSTDIDSVGDSTHLTFFEMLGNFSIGNYFKEDAILYAWEFVTQNLQIPAERLWATVYEEDNEARLLWINTGIPEERIRNFGADDNFWGPAGSEGPCGPCSELHYDFGSRLGCKSETCGPNCSNLIDNGPQVCNRFVELWNLVFMQYFQDQSGNRSPLPNPNIDTGMGLERCAAILQGKETLYETDIFLPIINRVSSLSGKPYGANNNLDYAIRVVAEHSRSAVFLISDGVVPGNEGRGYVLRRIIRRAIRYGKTLGLNEQFLENIGGLVIELMGINYPDLLERKDFILRVLALEEERFISVMQSGLAMLEGSIIPIRRMAMNIANDIPTGGTKDNINKLLSESIEEYDSGLPDWLKTHIITDLSDAMGKYSLAEFRSNASTITGKEAFALSDTYGFPPELTEEIANEYGFTLDMDGFIEELAQQKERARSAAGKFDGDFELNRKYQDLDTTYNEFLGYETLTTNTTISAILLNSEQVSEANKGDNVEIILEQTPFYPEMGGQLGDTGSIKSQSGELQVLDTQSPLAGLIVNKCKILSGTFYIGDPVTAEVENSSRSDTARNHTATHLLHSALRSVLGNHVRQHGSLVAPDRLRFDFTHVSSISDKELREVQSLVNRKIRENIHIHVDETTYRQAVSDGAIAFFGDRYGDSVRVVRVDDDHNNPFSIEVCGGTHVVRTGDIGYCYVVSESSIGAGLRRIEAVTGRYAENIIQNMNDTLGNISSRLQVPIEQIVPKTEVILNQLDESQRLALELERELLKQQVNSLGISELKGINLVAGQLTVSNQDLLREAGDWLRNRIKSGIIVIGTIVNHKPMLIITATKDISEQGFHAGQTVKDAAQAMDGKGGGRPEMGQAGGEDPNKLANAIAEATKLVEKWLNTLV